MNSVRRLLNPVAALAALAAFAGLAALGGCADVKEGVPVPTDSDINVHPSGWKSPSSDHFHGKAIASMGWDMRSCQQCHGGTYDGGISGVSCKSCHTSDTGPENCATCHGSSTANSPPEDLAGNTATSSPGVGAHQVHVLGGAKSLALWCADCHTVPGGVYDAGHVDSDLPAEVPMEGARARVPTDGIVPSPVHDPVALTCSNVYCHGNWKSRRSDAPLDRQFVYMDSVISGNNVSQVWTGGPPQAACGTCHNLPPAGHIPAPVSACGGCHTGVVDAAGIIVNKALHINGKINYAGTDRPF